MPHDRQRTKGFIELNQKTPFKFAGTYSHGRAPRPRIVRTKSANWLVLSECSQFCLASMTTLARLGSRCGRTTAPQHPHVGQCSAPIGEAQRLRWRRSHLTQFYSKSLQEPCDTLSVCALARAGTKITHRRFAISPIHSDPYQDSAQAISLTAFRERCSVMRIESSKHKILAGGYAFVGASSIGSSQGADKSTEPVSAR